MIIIPPVTGFYTGMERNFAMRYINAVLWTVAADILSLFIALTLAGSGNPLIRGISAVCTFGILVCVLGALGAKTASADRKSNKGSASAIGMGASAAAFPLASWLTLFFTAGSSFDFYRWYKLINGWGLQICNFINSDASANALTRGQIWLMLPVSAAPAWVLTASYLTNKAKN